MGNTVPWDVGVGQGGIFGKLRKKTGVLERRPFLGVGRGLALLRSFDFTEGDGVPDAQLIIEEDFDPVGAFGFEGGIEEDLDAGGGLFGGGEFQGDIAALGDGASIGGGDARFLNKFAFAAAPAVDDAELGEAGGEILDGETIKEANEDKFPIAFLSDIVADDGRLKIGEHD